MDGITVVEHPLVQHKLTLIRDRHRSTKSFRELLKETGMLLCYEVTRDLPLTDVEIETPMRRTAARKIAGKKLVFAPVLRAGTTFVEGMLDLVPTARVAHVGLYREHGGGCDRSAQGARCPRSAARLSVGCPARF
jgi:uracil phosphoribosyltransferase